MSAKKKVVNEKNKMNKCDHCGGLTHHKLEPECCVAQVKETRDHYRDLGKAIQGLVSF